ncbi:MAG: fluoride efflux transporter CrcB [Methylobacterium mesophilicum]|nr:fluoride efflux transporter CrcB [Methylobacterium mesophilicum]
MQSILLVALGGALGSTARHLVNMASMRLNALPWHTMVINILGSFLIGMATGWFARRAGTSNDVRLFIVTGVLGGFTTFSAFSLDIALLWERQATVQAVSYVLLTVLGSIVAVFLGLALARAAG